MKNFDAFKQVIERELLSHPVVSENPFTSWFKRGQATEDQVKDLVIQFSVFSNHFLIVQAKRMVFAQTEEGERCARNILMNECGVGLDRGTGSPEGRAFSSSNAHISWLRDLGRALDMPARELGRWENASPATKAFLRGLDRTYGSRDASTGAGASFAVETWASFGLGHAPELEARNFWKELIAGLKGHNARRAKEGLPALPLHFFEYHFALESGHGANVWQELEQSFGASGFSQARFIAAGKKALDSVHTFWKGLDQSRRRMEADRSESLAGINVAQWAF